MTEIKPEDIMVVYLPTVEEDQRIAARVREEKQLLEENIKNQAWILENAMKEHEKIKESTGIEAYIRLFALQEAYQGSMRVLYTLNRILGVKE